MSGTEVIEIAVDEPLVRRLLAAQFPQWADLPLSPVPYSGTDNAIFRLGEDLMVRLPRVEWAIGQVEKEQRWLPTLAPHLPLAIPEPVGRGVPGEGYPWSWSVYRWLPGENLAVAPVSEPVRSAAALGRFVTALHGIDAAGGPAPGEHNFFRGVPLSDRDEMTRKALARVWDLIDAEAAAGLWDDALRARPWPHAPVWVHGDLQQGNLLGDAGELTAVIDFGGLGVGDPACDLLPAWNCFSADAREAYRAALDIDEDTWLRGMGWALSVSVVEVDYYQTKNPRVTANALRVIAEVLSKNRGKDDGICLYGLTG